MIAPAPIVIHIEENLMHRLIPTRTALLAGILAALLAGLLYADIDIRTDSRGAWCAHIGNLLMICSPDA